MSTMTIYWLGQLQGAARAAVISRDILMPLIWQSWTQELVDHPDQTFANFILSGISCGWVYKSG